MKKSDRKIVSATAMALFNLTAIFIATAAWFTASRKVDSDGSGFEVVAYDGLVKSIKIYQQYEQNRYQYKENPSITYNVNPSTGAVLKHTTTDIGLYDQFSSPENSVLYIIELDSMIAKNHSTINLTAKTETDKDDSPLLKELESLKENKLGSIVNFININSGYVMDASKRDFTSATYLSNYNRFYRLPGEKSIHDETKTVTEIDYDSSFSLFSLDTSDIETTSDSIYLEYIVEYNTDALEYIYNLNLGSQILGEMEDDTYIEFVQDWTVTIQ